MEWTDLEAVNRALQGHVEAFRVLVERHSRPIYHLAYRMTGNPHDAEDIVQETFMRACKQLAKYDARAGFGTWLHRIAANCAIDLLRARNRRDSRTTAEPPADFVAPEPSPERLTLSGEIGRKLGPAMGQLSDMERTAFILRHHDGLSMEEIGQTLGVRPNAAKHSVFRAVQKLRRALEPAFGAAQ